jgi:hypothetical protein
MVRDTEPDMSDSICAKPNYLVMGKTFYDLCSICLGANVDHVFRRCKNLE